MASGFGDQAEERRYAEQLLDSSVPEHLEFAHSRLGHEDEDESEGFVVSSEHLQTFYQHQSDLVYGFDGDEEEGDICGSFSTLELHGETIVIGHRSDSESYVPSVSLSVPSQDDENDGWDSDLETDPPVLSLQATSSACGHLLQFDDGTWVDEALAKLASCGKKSLSPLHSLLKEFYSEHPDPYSLLLTFLRRAGRSRQAKHSLPRISLEVFQEWLAEKGNDISNAVLKPHHQSDALEILFSCHPMLMDPMCSVFELKSADKQSQIFVVQALLDSASYKEAATYAWKFELQDQFSMIEMLLPLIATDKINLIESYISASRKLQEDFVMLLDKLCESGTSYKHLSSYLATCGAKPKNSEVESKVSSKQLFKLGLRLIGMFGLELDKFPTIYERKSSNSLHHLLHKKYVEGGITDGNLDELIEAALRSRPSLQAQLIKELVQFQDFSYAAHWVEQLSIPMQYIPLSLRSYLLTHPSRPSDPHSMGEKSTEEFYQLPLPLECVFFVADERTLQRCLDTFAMSGNVIGMDAEWRLPACNGGIERMAVLQFATWNAVFLLDMVNLPRNVSEFTLRHFIKEVFGCSKSLKLGKESYSMDGDLNLLGRSWPFVADIVASPVRTVDLSTMSRMVRLLLHPRCIEDSGDGEVENLPRHPLLQGTEQSSVQGFPKAATATVKQSSKSQVKQCLPPPSELHSSHSGLETSTSDSPETERGLSKLVMTYFGKPLDKRQQLSDWERRPLREEQIKYAALDAHCLLGIYEQLKSEALSVDPHFNVEPCVHSIKISKSVFRKPK